MPQYVVRSGASLRDAQCTGEALPLCGKRPGVVPGRLCRSRIKPRWNIAAAPQDDWHGHARDSQRRRCRSPCPTQPRCALVWHVLTSLDDQKRRFPGNSRGGSPRDLDLVSTEPVTSLAIGSGTHLAAAALPRCWLTARIAESPTYRSIDLTVRGNTWQPVYRTSARSRNLAELHPPLAKVAGARSLLTSRQMDSACDNPQSIGINRARRHRPGGPWCLARY